MAEIVGVVASGISIGTLAAQVASSIIKLKSLWNELRDAPDDIKDLIDEAEILNNILLDLNDDDPSLVIGLEHQQSRVECLRYCQAASKKISLLVEDLHAEIEMSKGLRRKIISAKLILRKDQVKKYKSRLKGTVRLLSLSEQCYTRAYQRHIHTILTQMSFVSCGTRPLVQQEVQRAPLRVIHDSNDVENEDTLQIFDARSQKPPSRSSLQRLLGYVDYMTQVSRPTIWNKYGELEANDKDEDTSSYLRYRTPTWVANQIWEICNMKARNTWTCHLRVYHVIPRDSLLFEFIQKDNIDAVKALFSKGLASPFDRDDVKGETPLHIAASYGRLALCKLLLEAGADPDIPSFSSENTTPFHELCFYGGVLAFKNGVPVTDLHRLFLPRDVDVFSALHKFRGPKEAFQLLLQKMLASGFDLPLSLRVYTATWFSDAMWHNTPQLFRMAMGPRLNDSAAMKFVGERGMTIIHSVLRVLAQSVSYECWSLPPENYYDVGYLDQPTLTITRNYQWANMCREWSAVLAELLHAGADIHHLNFAQRTPLLEAFSIFSGESAGQSLNHFFRCWLRHVQDAGVDLPYFGEAETRLHTLGICNKDSLVMFDSETGDVYEYHLIGFSYGPCPDDWHFWMSDPTDVFAGDFWRSIEAECQERTIPGAWIE